MKLPKPKQRTEEEYKKWISGLDELTKRIIKNEKARRSKERRQLLKDWLAGEDVNGFIFKLEKE